MKSEELRERISEAFLRVEEELGIFVAPEVEPIVVSILGRPGLRRIEKIRTWPSSRASIERIQEAVRVAPEVGRTLRELSERVERWAEHPPGLKERRRDVSRIERAAFQLTWIVLQLGDSTKKRVSKERALRCVPHLLEAAEIEPPTGKRRWEFEGLKKEFLRHAPSYWKKIESLTVYEVEWFAEQILHSLSCSRACRETFQRSLPPELLEPRGGGFVFVGGQLATIHVIERQTATSHVIECRAVLRGDSETKLTSFGDLENFGAWKSSARAADRTMRPKNRR